MSCWALPAVASGSGAGNGTEVPILRTSETGQMSLLAKVNGHPMEMILDTGSEGCIFALSQLLNAGITVHERKNVGAVLGVGGSEELSSAAISLQVGGITRKITAYIIDDVKGENRSSATRGGTLHARNGRGAANTGTAASDATGDAAAGYATGDAAAGAASGDIAGAASGDIVGAASGHAAAGAASGDIAGAACGDAAAGAASGDAAAGAASGHAAAGAASGDIAGAASRDIVARDATDHAAASAVSGHAAAGAASGDIAGAASGDIVARDATGHTAAGAASGEIATGAASGVASAPPRPILGQSFLSGLTYKVSNSGLHFLPHLPKETSPAGIVSLPYRQVGKNIVVDVEINGRQCPMVLDTGASVVSFTAKQLSQLGLMVPGDALSVGFSGVGGERTSRLFALSSVRLGSLELHHVAACVDPEDTMELPLLGRSLLAGLSFTVDPKTHSVIFSQ